MPTSPFSPEPRTAHFGCIDAMRGVAAICVVIFHYTRFYMPRADNPVIPVQLSDIPYAALLGPLYAHGEDFVRLFWAISGFVFAHVYWQRDTDARAFAIARFARLYPLHFVTLIFVAIVQIISVQVSGHWQIVGNNDLRHFVLQVFLMDSSLSFSNGNSFNAPIWSVSAEIFVYVVFFATLPLTKRRPFVASLLLAALCFASLAQRPDGFLIGHLVFVCGVFFFAGSACYAVYRNLVASMSKLLLVITALCATAVFATLTANANLLLLSLSCAVVLGLAALEQGVASRTRLLRFLGDISYSLYLVHIPLQIVVLVIVDAFFGGGRGFAGHLMTLPIYLGGSIWIAYLANVYLEKPVGKWLRNRLSARPKPKLKPRYPSSP
jgi:peptidoglycan/LPS O-acetylase OafA/YrhL